MKRIIAITVMLLMTLPTFGYASERLSMGYIYDAPVTYSRTIKNTNDSINVVSPTGFDLTPDGRLDVNISIKKEFVEEMHEKNIKITPFLSNHWGTARGKAALNNPERLVESLKKQIEDNNLDGVNVDLENLPVEYKDKLTNFVKLLKEALPKDKTVSVAVAANPNKLTSTWVATYDYAGLAEYADYLVLMAYDEHGQGGQEGAVASINFVNDSLKYILENVSRDKVVLGIPLYGRYWEEEADYGGDAITTSKVEEYIKKYHLKPIVDKATMTATVQLDVLSEDQKIVLNSGYAKEGTYHIYYENEETIKAKLKLVNDYNILGSALWALNQEDSSFWKYYKQALNEKEYESERSIRIRERQDAYSKFVKMNEVPVKVEMKKIETPSYDMEEEMAERLTELKEEAYDMVEHLVEDDKKYYLLAKKQRRMIKGIDTKSHFTVTLVTDYPTTIV